MNIDNLKALRDFEQNKELDMSDYDCGTAHCHAGWEIVRASSGNIPWEDGFKIWKTAQKTLDLNAQESAFLFHGVSHYRGLMDDDFTTNCNALEGKGRLDYLIKHKRIPDNIRQWASQFYV